MYSWSAIIVFLALPAAVKAADPIEVYPDTKIHEHPGNKYCITHNKQCSKGNIVLRPFSAVDTMQCLIRCNREITCSSTFYSEDNICFMRDDRCALSELSVADGEDFYRLKKGETCTNDRPVYDGPPVTYSKKFCRKDGDKRCPGHDLYRRPQRKETMMACLEKCAKIHTCASVDFVSNQCSPKSYQCKDDELVDEPGVANFQRLEKGQTECSPGSGPAVACPPNSVSDGDECPCLPGYEKVGDQCWAVCPSNSVKYGGRCFCTAGSKRVGDHCVKE